MEEKRFISLLKKIFSTILFFKDRALEVITGEINTEKRRDEIRDLLKKEGFEMNSLNLPTVVLNYINIPTTPVNVNIFVSIQFLIDLFFFIFSSLTK